VLEGGAEVAGEAGVAIVGGHSIHDPEPKYGMAVTGFVRADAVVRNSTMRPGDVLFLTKPLGLGIVSTAVKRGEATPEQVKRAVEVMTTLNRAASEAMVHVGVSAATDVTGFGLLGHLHIALEGSGAAARIRAADVPLLPGTLELAERGVVPSGTHSNRSFVAPHLDWGELPKAEQLVLADAQTSGGLLLSVPADRASEMAAALAARGADGWEVGHVEEGVPGRVAVEGRVGR
jgi:selenide,water dikinase